LLFCCNCKAGRWSKSLVNLSFDLPAQGEARHHQTAGNALKPQPTAVPWKHVDAAGAVTDKPGGLQRLGMTGGEEKKKKAQRKY
jgi:hypothetical protein